MDNARVAQLGTPAEIYENPRTAFVAKFIGESNFFQGSSDEELPWGMDRSRRRADRSGCPHNPRLGRRSEVRIAVRPEWMDVCRPGEVPAGRECA